MCSDLSDLKTGLDMDVQYVSFGPNVDFPFDRKNLIKAQKSDSTLTSCFTAVMDKTVLHDQVITYFLDDGVLMRKWSPEEKRDWNSVFQVVVPNYYREYVLRVLLSHLHSCTVCILFFFSLCIGNHFYI